MKIFEIRVSANGLYKLENVLAWQLCYAHEYAENAYVVPQLAIAPEGRIDLSVVELGVKNPGFLFTSYAPDSDCPPVGHCHDYHCRH